MTIQRQYSSPSCQLTLQGLSESHSPSESRPCMSMLMNAECKFMDSAGHSISGGRDFFESLVTRVSRYTQSMLSEVMVPETQDQSEPLQNVTLQKLDHHLHRLTVYPDQHSGLESGPKTQAMTVDLTTVQLFDLVETIDQFFADSRTLPDLTLNLQPASKRYVKPEQPTAQRIVPAAIGISSVALAAIAFLTLPVPEVKRPRDLLPQPQTQDAPGTIPPGTPPDGLTQPQTPSSEVSPQSTLTPSQTITNPEAINGLQSQLDEKLIQTWTVTPELTRPLIYRVSVAENGDIIGYASVNNATPEEEKLIPLPQLLYRIPGDARPTEPVADFAVRFNPDGRLEINPWLENGN